MKFFLPFFSILNFGLIRALPTNEVTVSSTQLQSMEKVTAANKVKAKEANPSDTENGMSGPCKPVTMIFARGTGESGNVGGDSSPGPALFAELRRSLGEDKIAVQGVPYNANVMGYLLGGDPEGSQNVMDLTHQATAKCPDTKLVLSGYSQGAQVIHNAADQYSTESTSRVAATVLFGDPFVKKKVGDIPSSTVLNICHDEDIICKGSGGAQAHLTYSNDAPAAAAFIIQRVK